MIHRINNYLKKELSQSWRMQKGLSWYNRAETFTKKVFLYVLLIDGAFIFLLPVLYMLLLSFFTAEDLLDASIRWIPVHFFWENYRIAFEMLSYPSSLIITLMLTGIAVFGQTTFCSLAGYALARLDFPGRQWIMNLVLLVLVIPSQAMVLPNYIYFYKLKLLSSIWPLILPELLGNGLYGALFIFIFRQVFADIPKDLEDAAAIDGAGLFKTFYLIVAPLAQNAYITVGLFSFVLHWNEYIRPLYYLSVHGGKKTLSLALSYFFSIDSFGNPMANDAVKGAGVILVMMPVILIYALVQKHFVTGVQLTGIKG